jgi:hypothetical protein
MALFPTASGLLASGHSTSPPSATSISNATDGGMSILPIAETPVTGTFDQPGAGTCSVGSLYLGKVYGQSDFPANVALSVSNGPCGRMSVEFEPQPSINAGDLPQAMARRWIAIS